MIRFDSVTKEYPGGTVAVGGLTSLRMVNRLIEPTRGSISLDGVDTASLPANDLRRGIGYVIQHAGLFPHRTIVDNIGTVPALLGWDRRKTRDRALDLMQRVGVARALAADPPVMLMDEPFSAVDPVVREQLQDLFLHLQGDLGKTIVFVTHDIDEAIKLGDQVAVLRVGGRLAQVADPATLLARPADDFVADFLGRDRGYRALGFRDAPRLPLHGEPTIVLGERADAAGAEWVLVLDDARGPLGWVRPARLSGPVTEADLALGGTLARLGGSLPEALDAALSSPSGRGVVVDETGAFCGSITPQDVVALITHDAAADRAPRAGTS